MSNARDLWYDWLGLNTWLFKQINSLSDLPIYSSLIKTITIFGEKKYLSIMIGLIGIFAIVSIIDRMVTKKGGMRNYIFTWISIFLLLGAGFTASHFTIDYIKNHYSYARPYVSLPASQVILLETPTAEDTYNSFPSRHSFIITILVFSLWPALNLTFRWIGIFLIFFVAWSRVALGMNFPMDVVSGFTLAMMQMLIIRYVLYSIIRGIRRVVKV